MVSEMLLLVLLRRAPQQWKWISRSSISMQETAFSLPNWPSEFTSLAYLRLWKYLPVFQWSVGVMERWSHEHNHQNLCCCSVEDEKLFNLIFGHSWNCFQFFKTYIYINVNLCHLFLFAATSGREARGRLPCLWSKILSGQDTKHCSWTHVSTH